MARQFRVEIDGNRVQNVLDVEYGLDVSKDKNGAPVDANPRLQSIRITRRSDETTDLWNWAMNPHEEYFKSGKIEFLHPRHEDKVIKTVEWESGFVKAYVESLPDVNKRSKDPQTETVEISAAKISINGSGSVEWAGSRKWL